MHKMMRTTLCLLATSLVLLVPGASAAPGIDVDARAQIELDATLDDATATAEDALARAEATVREAEAQATARVEEAAAGIEAEASAQASAGENAAQRALAGLQTALEALGEFASGFFARVDVGARLG